MTKGKIDPRCGGRASKDGKGAKGMTNEQLLKFIKESNANVYARLGSSKKREDLCEALTKFPAGRALLAEANNKPKAVVAVPNNDPFKPMMQKPKMQVVVNEFGESNYGSNGNSNSNNEVTNYANSNNENESFERTQERGRRNWVAMMSRGNKQPNFEKMMGRNVRRIKKNLRMRKRKGMQMPVGKTLGEIIKNELVMKPKNITAARKKEAAAKRRVKTATPKDKEAAIERLRKMGFNVSKRKVSSAPKTFLAINKAISEATGRIPTKSQLVVGRQKYNKSQIKKAYEEANRVMNLFDRAGLLPNEPRKNASDENRANYASEMKATKNQLYKNALEKMPKPRTPSPVKPGGNVTRVENLFNLNLEIKKLEAIKAKNRNSSQTKKLSILKSMKAMQKLPPSFAANAINENKPVVRRGRKQQRVILGPSPPKNLSTGIMVNNASVAELRQRKANGGKLTNKEQTILNVANKLKNAAAAGAAAAASGARQMRPGEKRSEIENANAFANRFIKRREPTKVEREAFAKRLASQPKPKPFNLSGILNSMRKNAEKPRVRVTKEIPATIRNVRGKGYYSMYA